jgi:hypothetical protein
MFKWVCLGVAVVALAAFGWMINDVRLEVKALAQKADQIAVKADELVAKTDRQLPVIQTQTEQVTTQLDRHLPSLLSQTEGAARTINTHLPTLLARSEVAVDNVSDLADSFKQYKGLMGVVHAATQNKGLFGYGLGVLSMLEGQNATIGVKKHGAEGGLKQVLPVKAWASSAQKDVHFLSLFARTKEEMLHGLARSSSPAPLHIQVGDQPPHSVRSCTMIRQGIVLPAVAALALVLAAADTCSAQGYGYPRYNYGSPYYPNYTPLNYYGLPPMNLTRSPTSPLRAGGHWPSRATQ